MEPAGTDAAGAFRVALAAGPPAQLQQGGRAVAHVPLLGHQIREELAALGFRVGKRGLRRTKHAGQYPPRLCAAWAQGGRKIVAVEPETCCALQAATRAGTPVDVEVSGIAANALGARRIGQICFDLVTEQTVETVTVPDSAIAAAQTRLWQSLRQFVEPGGATALAALISGSYTPAKGEKVAVLICGANPAPDPFL